MRVFFDVVAKLRKIEQNILVISQLRELSGISIRRINEHRCS